MVLVHIYLESSEDADMVISKLQAKKLILDATINQVAYLKNSTRQKTNKKIVFVLKARTKALLFESLQKELRHLFKGKMPQLFATPIVYMEPDQALKVRKKTRPI